MGLKKTQAGLALKVAEQPLGWWFKDLATEIVGSPAKWSFSGGDGTGYRKAAAK